MIPFELTWQAPEFEERDRDVSWYWVSIIIAAVLVTFAVWQRNFLFGIFILIAEILMIVWAGREPRLIHFSISDRGIVIDERKHYLLNEFETFSADEFADDDYADFMFHFKGRFHPPLQIKVPAEDASDLKKMLKQTLKEIPHEPSFIDSLERLIGF